jgi:hypothetical protein
MAAGMPGLTKDPEIPAACTARYPGAHGEVAGLIVRQRGAVQGERPFAAVDPQRPCRYTAALLAAIRAHHDSENDIIWPLTAAAAGQAVDLAPLADDRLVIEEASGRVQGALACFAAAPGTGAAVLHAPSATCAS